MQNRVKKERLSKLQTSFGLRFTTIFVLLLISCGFCTPNCFSLELSILDCNGSTRAVRRVEPLSKSEVKVEVTDANGEKLDGQELKLKSVDGTQTIVAKSVEGTVIFPQVPQGAWILSSDNPAVFLSAVTVSETIAAGVAVGIASGALVAGGAAVTGGIIGIDNVVNSNNRDDEIPSDNSPDPTPQPVIPTPRPARPTLVPPTNCVACDPEQEAPELPDFFESVEAISTPISPSF